MMLRLNRTVLSALAVATWLTVWCGPNAMGQPRQQMTGLTSLPTQAQVTVCAAKPGEAIPCHGQTFDVTVERSIPGEPVATPTARRVLPQPGDTRLRTKYDVRYTVKPRLIGLKLDQAGVRSGALEFDVKALNPKGRLASLVSQRANLRFTSEEYAEFLKKPFEFMQQVDLPPGKFTLQVGILDDVAKRTPQIVQISLAVPAPPGS
jgi:hypothetical protein